MASTITFWNFIKNNIIEIPIIQRDYAQGRLGKEHLRKSFLTNLKLALDGQMPNGEELLKLDFVYGSTENSIHKPLDGQQRMTTLWLLHWYIALKANKLEEAGDILKRFTYETRISSREFCHSLCDAKRFTKYDSDSVVDFITGRTWFYTAWKQDPTIQAMLRMLGGTRFRDKKGEDFVDGIEELFRGTGPEEYLNYWNLLTSDKAPVVFYHLPLEDFGLSDDLYIKMNARGKQLTAFENFKAELVGYIREKGMEDQDWKCLSDAIGGVPILMDTTWTDLFWNRRSIGVAVKDRQNNVIQKKANQIDEIFLSFMNRFFWNELFMAKNSENKYLLQIGEGRLVDGTTSYSIENENGCYRYLNEDRCDLYSGLDPYKFHGGEIPQKLLIDLKAILDNYIVFDKDIPVCQWGKDFRFIPEYEVGEDGNNIEVETGSKDTYLKVTSLNQVHRIVFFAVCKYFKEGQGEDISINRWMRVVWNLVSGIGEDGRPQIRSTNAMRTAMEFLDTLDSHHVYESLASDTIIESVEKEKTSDFKNRCLEEIAKAKQILNSNGSCDWETLLVKAENYAFFRGSIRFLFTGADGCVDWNDFEIKWTNAQLFFRKEYSAKESVMNQEYRNANLLKALISRFTAKNFWNTLWWKHRTFNNKQESWLYYLLNDDIYSPIHELMCGNTTIIDLTPSNRFEENALYYLSNTKLLDYVRENIPNSWIRDYHGHKAIFPSGPGVFLDDANRNHLLLNTEEILLPEENVIPETDLLFGLDVNFKYHNCNFQWYRTDFVYLMEDDNPYSFVVKNNESSNETEKHYCFNASSIVDPNALCEQLDLLITQHQSLAS